MALAETTGLTACLMTEGRRMGTIAPAALGAAFGDYAVYLRKDGRRAVVLANMSDSDSIVCEVKLDGAGAAGMTWVSPEQPEAQPWAGKLELAPGVAAVLLEG